MPESSIIRSYLKVKYLPETFELSISWKGEVSEAELVSGYQDILKFLKSYPVCRILLDLSQRKKLNIPGGTQTIFSEIFKEALQVIKRPLFLAMVLTKEEYFLSSEASIFDRMVDMDNDFVITHLFSNCDEAQEWLCAAALKQ